MLKNSLTARTTSVYSEKQNPPHRPPNPGAAVFLFPAGGAMSRRGRPRKDGPRHANGRRRFYSPNDQGHDLVLAHRALIVGKDNLKSQRNDTVYGRLFLAGKLRERDHRACERYESLHARAFRGLNGRPSPTTRSQVAALLASDGRPLSELTEAEREAQRRKDFAAYTDAVDRLAMVGQRAFRMFENIVVYGREFRWMDTTRKRTPAGWAADDRDMQAFLAAAEQLVRHFRLEKIE